MFQFIPSGEFQSSILLGHCLGASSLSVTSRGERVPLAVGIQYSRINIKGDMSKYMNNSDSFILN